MWFEMNRSPDVGMRRNDKAVSQMEARVTAFQRNLAGRCNIKNRPAIGRNKERISVRVLRHPG